MARIMRMRFVTAPEAGFNDVIVGHGSAGGLIGDITVLQRPGGVTANFRDGILPALAGAVPLPAWHLDGTKAPPPRRGTASRCHR